MTKKRVASEEMLPGPAVAGHSVQRDDSLCTLLIDQQLVPCSPIEYRLLLLLLGQADRCVPYIQLIACLYENVPTEAADLRQARNKVTHQISGLRTKIWSRGLDIVSVMGVGYILLSSPIEETIASSGAASTSQHEAW